MLVINPKALCFTCFFVLKVHQKNNMEKDEKWVCLKYKEGVPLVIYKDAGNCFFYEKDL